MTVIALKFLLMSSPTLSHFPNFLLATKLQRPLFQHSHWSPEHMAHYILLLLISIPGIHNLACLFDVKITRYTDKALLNFVEIYFSIHCYTISALSLYFHVHILCTLYENLTNLEIIYVNHWLID